MGMSALCKKFAEGGASAGCFQVEITYFQVTGTGSDCFLCDGEIEFDDRGVSHPVRNPFTFLLWVFWVEGYQWLVVSIEIDGTEKDLELHCLRTTEDLNVWVIWTDKGDTIINFTFLTTLFVDEGQMTPLFHSSCLEHAAGLTWEANTNLRWTGCRLHDISRFQRRRDVKTRKGGWKRCETMMIVVSLTWMSECGVSDASILSTGENECNKLICSKGQPHCLCLCL